MKTRGGGRKEGGINIQVMLTFLTQEKIALAGVHVVSAIVSKNFSMGIAA